TYSADILMYVNNHSISIGSSSVTLTSGDITAARDALNTYLVVMKSRQCLDKVIKQAGLKYSRSTLSNMITAGAVNNTEIFRVYVTSKNPSEARVIANTIAEVLPEIITNTIQGSTVEVIDGAVQPTKKVAPDILKTGILSFLAACVLMCVIIFFKELSDDAIHGNETLLDMYDSIPVLADIPYNGLGKKYSKYNSYGYDKKA
ncbi:MAG: hypothetical protein KBS41_03040, partial [Oscillospiraceae bacterium]|nr:hypothetical protein [Candidatus Equicaccousia limihippi]